MSSSEEDEQEGEQGGEGGEGGIEVYPFGEYEGARDDQLDRHGFGSALLPNNDIYEGEYLHGKRHGLGMYCFKNGARYDGHWRKGLKHGKGVFLYPDGTRYIGDWRKDYKHGHGTYYYINGDMYEGCWYKNLRHGLGTYVYKAANVTYFGTWKSGCMETFGIVNYPYYQYHGSFTRNLPKGPGCFTFDAKYMQHGYYINMRDPAFDYLGVEDLAVNDAEVVPDSNRGNPKGIVPVWRARSVTKYQSELLPPEPVPLLVKDSQESLIDIIDYLQQQHEKVGVATEDVEERTVTSPELPHDLIIPDPVVPEPDLINEPVLT